MPQPFKFHAGGGGLRADLCVLCVLLPPTRKRSTTFLCVVQVT